MQLRRWQETTSTYDKRSAFFCQHVIPTPLMLALYAQKKVLFHLAGLCNASRMWLKPPLVWLLRNYLWELGQNGFGCNRNTKIIERYSRKLDRNMHLYSCNACTNLNQSMARGNIWLNTFEYDRKRQIPIEGAAYLMVRIFHCFQNQADTEMKQAG